jgi:hypothetical protein
MADGPQLDVLTILVIFFISFFVVLCIILCLIYLICEKGLFRKDPKPRKKRTNNQTKKPPVEEGEEYKHSETSYREDSLEWEKQNNSAIRQNTIFQSGDQILQIPNPTMELWEKVHKESS